MIYFDSSADVKEVEEIEELTGKLSKQNEENKLMNSVLENDKKTVEDGKLLKDALNQGMSSFTPDLMFQDLIKNYSMAKNIYGPSLIKYLTGYEPEFVKRNINVPEFKRELIKNIKKNFEKLKDSGLINREGFITDKGVKLASLILYTEELDNILPKGILGEKIHKERFIYGDKEYVKDYKKGDRYRDIAVRKTIKLAIRRQHSKINQKDLKAFERQSKGQISLIYALDASGSMKGKKIEICKKAGIALAFKAIDEKDKVGLIVFGSDVKEELTPTDDFSLLLDKITRIKASKETNITKTIEKSIELFPNKKITKHLILITDAMPTVGKNPEEETLEAVSKARNSEITISVIGIDLDIKAKTFAEKIAKLGDGRLYIVKDLKNLDKIVLEDYYSVV